MNTLRPFHNESNPVRVVCFDWGGVILRICRSWAEGCAAAGLPVRGDTASAGVKARRKAASESYQRGLLTTEEFLHSIHEAVNGAYTIEELARIHDAFLIEEYPGVGSVVDDLLRTPGIQTGMLSNTNDLHWRRQHAAPESTKPHFPTAARLRHRHASHLLGLAKPSPEIYRAFEVHTGFHGGEVLFFDDLEENIAAARSSGWKAEQIDHTGDPAAQMRTFLARHGVLTS